MKALEQITAVTAMNLSAIRNRLSASVVVVVGMIAVVAVTLSVLSLSSGLLRLIAGSVDADHVIVLSHDARYEGPSTLDRTAVQAIMDTPGIRRDGDGKPTASASTLAGVPSVKKADGLTAFIQLRGVNEGFFKLHPDIKLIEGKMFTPALREVIVGADVRNQFEGYNLGDNISLQDGDWKIVGIFTSQGLWNSNILADGETMLSAFRRNAYNSLTARIDPGTEAFDAFKAALTTNPSLAVDVEREPAYYARQFEFINTLLRAIALWVGGVMALGAVFGALNTMYSAVSTRVIEIATLRAIGFGATPVVISIVAESLMLAVCGGLVGAAIAWLAYNGKTHLLGGLTFSLTISPAMLGFGVGLAIFVGLIGAASRPTRSPASGGDRVAGKVTS